MADDWRIRATLASDAEARELMGALAGGKVNHDLNTGGGQRVVVSRDGSEVFLYAGTREQAERASDVVQTLAASSSIELCRWHPVAEEWEDPDKPLPSSGDAVGAEEQELGATEDADSEARKLAEFEVRVELSSHHDTVSLGEALLAEGIPSVRRWRYLLVGAEDELAAKKLAEHIQGIAPADAKLEVEGSAAVLPGNPFAVFGGLA